VSFDLGKDTSFNPPPPPKRRLSPWAMTGIGCAVLLVGSIAGLGTCAVQMSNAMKEELKKPIDKQQVLAELGDTPLYPKVQFDEQGTKVGRAGMKVGGRFVPAQSTAIVGFRTEDSASLVYDWYDIEMPKLGFRREDGKGDGRGGHTYRKDHDMVIVQMTRTKGELNGMMLMRFFNIKK
jgi:hypothetical protein